MSEHLPVMAAEVVEFLVTRTNGGYVDCTVGAGGHARFILNNAPEGRLLGLDLDTTALEKAGTRLAAFGERAKLVKGNFADLAAIADEHGFHGIDGVLFDLGFSSMQLDDPARGFSYQSEGPIDMRLDGEGATTANALLLRVSERDLAQLIFEYGEEKRARPIARSIIWARENGKLVEHVRPRGRCDGDEAEAEEQDTVARLPGASDSGERRAGQPCLGTRAGGGRAEAGWESGRHLVPLA